MRARLSWWLCLLLLLPHVVLAQVIPPGGGGGGSGTFPVTNCTNAVGTGITAQGILTCEPVTPAMTTGLVPSGLDITATGQVTATHLATPLPLAQGGLGLTAGNSGGVLYFPTSTTLAASPLLPLDAPLFGGGDGNPPKPGIRSGTTLEVATILGPHTPNKQLTYDANGNVVASAVDVGTATSDVISVFGRQGAVVAQSGDYTASQVTNAADLTQANVFLNPNGQTMPRLNLSGTISGTLTMRAPAFAGTSVLTWPAGTLDMTATGGPGQVLKQVTAAGPLSVGTLNFTELAGTATAAQVPSLPNLLGVLPVAKGGLGWTDTTFSGSTHLLATVTGALTVGNCLTADGQGNIVTTGAPCGTGSGGGGSGTILPGTSGVLPLYTSAGTTLGQSTIVAAEVVTAANAFPVAARVVQTGSGRTVSETNILISALCTTTGVCAGYQASLGFTPENIANKDAAPILSTSNTTYPTSGAAKAYIDAGLATKQNSLGYTAENTANKSDTTGLGLNVTLYPTQRAVKDYVDTHVATDAQIPDLNTLSTGLAGGRCVETDATGKLGVAAAACGTGSGATGISGATNHGLMVATGGTTGSSLGVATNGQIPIGSTGADPVLATLTGTANQIRVTSGPGSITLDFPPGGVTIPGTTTGTFSGSLTGNAATASALSAVLGCAQHPALTGDITTASGSCATALTNNSVTLAKMATMATSSLLGRVSAGAGNPEALTPAQTKTLLALDQVSNDAQLKRSANDFATFPVKTLPVNGDLLLIEDSAAGGIKRYITIGSLPIPPPVTDGNKGDVTVSASGATWMINPNSVTYGKLQDVSAASRLLGRGSAAGSGDPEEITLGGGLAMTGTTLSVAGKVNVSGTPAAGQLAAWTDPTTIQGITSLGIAYAGAHVSTAGTVSSSIEYVTTGAGGVTRTLPAAASSTALREFVVIKEDAGVGALTVARAGADTLNGPDGTATTTVATTTRWAGFLIREMTTNSWHITPINIGSGVNGVSYPANPAVDTVPTVTATNTVSYKAVPDCDDTTGQHLNYDTASHTWLCGNSTRTVPAFVVFSNPPTTPTSIGPVDSNTTNEVRVADMSGTANLDAPTGSPFEGQRLRYAIYCTTPRTLTYTTTSGGFAGEAGLNLPSKCIGGSYLILEFRWSAQSTRWALVYVSDRRPKTASFGDVASITINTNTTELAVYALGAATQSGYTVNLNTAATPYDGQVLRVRFTTSVGAAAKSITWQSSIFTSNAGITLPTVTTGNGTQDEFGFEWNEAAGSWVMLASTQNSISARRRTCMMRIGDESGSVLADTDLGPSNGWCDIPTAATIEEIAVRADAGTPSVLPHRRTGTTSTNLLSGALSTAAAGGVACARATGTGTTGFSGATCSTTLQNTAIGAGDFTLGLTSGTANGAKRVTVSIHYLLAS